MSDDKLRAALERIRNHGYQPMYNGRPSCPFCFNFVDNEETHKAGCILVAALAASATDEWPMRLPLNDPSICEICGELADGEPGRCHRHFRVIQERWHDSLLNYADAMAHDLWADWEQKGGPRSNRAEWEALRAAYLAARLAASATDEGKPTNLVWRQCVCGAWYWGAEQTDADRAHSGLAASATEEPNDA